MGRGLAPAFVTVSIRRDSLIWLFARLPTATNKNVGDLSQAAFAKFQANATNAPSAAQSRGLSSSRAVSAKPNNKGCFPASIPSGSK